MSGIKKKNSNYAPKELLSWDLEVWLDSSSINNLYLVTTLYKWRVVNLKDSSWNLPSQSQGPWFSTLSDSVVQYFEINLTWTHMQAPRMSHHAQNTSDYTIPRPAAGCYSDLPLPSSGRKWFCTYWGSWATHIYIADIDNCLDYI